MKIKLTGKNEFVFYPNLETDKGNNGDLPEDERFGIVVRKVTSPIFAEKYMEHNAITGDVLIRQHDKLRLNVVGLKNAPTLDFERSQESEEEGEKSVSRPMVLEDLFNPSFSEFFEVLQELQMFIFKIESEGIETKKS